MTHASSPLTGAHIYLTVFANGWATLGAIGRAIHWLLKWVILPIKRSFIPRGAPHLRSSTAKTSELSSVLRELTIQDPRTFTRDWTVSIPMTTDGAPTEILEYACQEGQQAVRNILSGARAQERKAAGTGR